MAAAAATARVCVPSSSGFRFTHKAKGKKFATKSRTAAAAAASSSSSSSSSSPRSMVRARAAVADDPLSDEERAELDLLDHADAIKKLRQGKVGAWNAEQDGEPMTPEAIRIMQQKEEFWVGQRNNYEAWYNPKKYGDVMSEFTGTIDVEASPEVCYALWNDTSALMQFVPGLVKAERTPDERCAECILLYQFADSRTHPLEELRFMTAVAECEENAMIHWQSTDGFPNGVVIAIEPGPSDGASATVKMDFYCHVPFDLAQKEGVMTVSLDVEERIAECLQRFAALAASVEKDGGVQAIVDGDDDEEIVIEAGVLPTGTGLVGADGQLVGRGGDTKVSRVAMMRAAKEFEARVGRKPFTVELLKHLYN